MPSFLEALFCVACVVPAAYLYAHIADGAVRTQLAVTAGYSVLAYFATVWLVSVFSSYLSRRGLKGRDMGRRGTPLEHVEMCDRAQRRRLAHASAHVASDLLTRHPRARAAAPLPWA